VKHTTIALLVGISLFIGALPCMSQIRAEASPSEEQLKQREADRQKIQKAMESERKRELVPEPVGAKSRKKENMNEESRPETGTPLGMPVERRPGGCPEGPPCMGRP
jgi:hypothetical protein